jgi:hypothetical protein
MTKTHENIAQSLLGSKIDSSLPVTYNIKHLNAQDRSSLQTSMQGDRMTLGGSKL